ncbi:adenylate/guanylate cyclase domain-containing protein [Stackebrandtia soli]|uniref:adenylate/guanylate cyclase domain-containing protein n=1 Tax=Stackebrandtia soli TaxID=1892856 RepID=UPI0039EC0BCD
MGNTVAPGSQLPSGQVTFLFTDIEGSTRLACELGETYRKILNDHRRLLREVFTRYTGTELLTEGDSFFVAFRDANTGMRAALAAQAALGAHDWPADPKWREPARPKVRMGLHTGHATPDQHGYASSTVHRAARICSAAHGDQILCSQSTLDAAPDAKRGTTVKDLGLHLLRGFDDAERLHQLTPLGCSMAFPPPAAVRRQHNQPAFPDAFVGRAKELNTLTSILKGHRVTTVTALPKAGKTRLVCRLAEQLSERYHDGAWYVPLSEETSVAKAVAGALGLREDPFRPLLSVVIEALRHRRCLLVLDDTREADRCDVTAIIAECPNVTVLAASLRPLQLSGEVKWALPTMEVPDAAALLRQRAKLAAGGVDLGDCTAIAAYVDGFVPAINILAPTVPLLGPAGLMRLLQCNNMSAVDKDGALSKILDATYGALTSTAAKLLQEMSQHREVTVDDMRRWRDMETAESMHALLELVDTSLVSIRVGTAGAQYRLPSPVRWYVHRIMPRPALVTSFQSMHNDLPLHSHERLTADEDLLTPSAWVLH